MHRSLKLNGWPIRKVLEGAILLRIPVLLFCILLGFSGCSAGGSSRNEQILKPTIQFLQTSPLPLPRFILTIQPEPGTEVAITDEIYVSIYQGGLWELGNDAEDLHIHIMANTFIYVDGKQIKPEVNASVYEQGRDENGEFTDKFFNPINFHFKPNSVWFIAIGSHLATIRTTSLSGVKYEYSWVFVVMAE